MSAARSLSRSPASPALAARLGVGLSTALLWAVVAGSAAYWLLQMGDRNNGTAAPSAHATGTSEWRADGAAVARSLGVFSDAAPAAASPVESAPRPDALQRLRLHGVLTHGATGAALLALDEQPARPVRVGQDIQGLDDGWTLHAVRPHAVVLAHGALRQQIDMPAMDERSTAGDAQAPLAQGAQDSSGTAHSAAVARAQAQARAMVARQRAAARP